MSLFRNKKIVFTIIILIAVFILIGVFVFTVDTKEDKSITVTNNPQLGTRDSDSKIINVNKLETYFEEDTAKKINESLYAYSTHGLKDVSNSYDGDIRKDSVINKEVGDHVPYLELIIDIPKLKRSYKVSSEGGVSSGYYNLYVLCLSSQELIYPAFDCKDDVNTI